MNFEMRQLVEEIESWKGETLLIEGKLLNKDHEDHLRGACIESRND